jgi:hypothetical protein
MRGLIQRYIRCTKRSVKYIQDHSCGSIANKNVVTLPEFIRSVRAAGTKQMTIRGLDAMRQNIFPE